MLISPQNTIPITYIFFNRLDCVKQTFPPIKMQKPEQLFLISDGPRVGNDLDGLKIRDCRSFINEQIDWKCEVYRLYQDTNLGAGKNITTGLNWVFSQIDRTVILEDDCLPDPSFFRFCQELLEKYKDDDRIGMIGGSNHTPRILSSSYFFSNFTMVWGWATWKRAWKYHDFEMSLWPDFKNNRSWLIEKIIDEENYVYWFNILDNLYRSDKSQVWDYQWSLALWVQNMLSIIPTKNLVKNIGFGPDATHTKVDHRNLSNIGVDKIDFPLIHPKGIYRNHAMDSIITERIYSNYRKGKRPFFLRIRRVLKKLLKALKEEF